MINEKLYHATFSRLCASEEAKKEVLAKMKEQTKQRHLPKILRAAAIAAMLTIALAVTANAATNGVLFENLRIVFQSDSEIILEDDAGNRVSVVGVNADAELRDGRLILTTNGEETDVTDALENDGTYTTSVPAGDTEIEVTISGSLDNWYITTSSESGNVSYEDGVVTEPRSSTYVSASTFDGSEWSN